MDYLLDKVSIVILSYNRKEELSAIAGYVCMFQKKYRYEVVIVDNASTDGTVEILRNLKNKYPEIKVIYNYKNYGVAQGRNIGWSASEREYILSIDDDTDLKIENIKALLDFMGENLECGILSPKIVHPMTLEIQNDHGPSVCEVANYHGACHLLRREVFEHIGEIDPECAFGGEELDYSIRARVSGYSIVYAPNITVFHKSKVRQGDIGRDRSKMWLYNYVRVLYKHFPRRMAFVYSWRIFISHFVYGVKRHGVVFALSLLKYLVNGRESGLNEYKAIPSMVVEYYMDTKNRPEYGNVPITEKIKKIISRK